MSPFREKIIRALLENAFVALFEFYRYRDCEAARIQAESEENAALVAIGEGGSNGTRRSAASEWLYGHRRRLIDEYKTRGCDANE